MKRCSVRTKTRTLNSHGFLGFSLAEILVVIAVIGLLLAIGLPAIQMAHESSRNTQCKNNLRQFGTAIQNLSSQMGRMPKDGRNGWGFGVFMLPQLEQSTLFNKLSPLTNIQGSTAQAGTTGMQLSVFSCPSFSPEPPLVNGFGRSNYLGTTAVFTTRIHLTDIVDGESNTFAIGEAVSDLAWSLPGTGNGNLPPNTGGSYGSSHSGGANFVFCDGSVKFIPNNIDTAMFRALFTTSGGEVINW